MYKNIETDRLVIRPINLTDSTFMMQLVNAEGWLKFIGNRNITNEDAAKKYIQKIVDNPNFYYSVFQLKSTKEPLGIITFLKRTEQKYPDIGFAILPEYEKIIAITVPVNEKSISLLLKLGLEYEADYPGDQGTLSIFSLSTEKSLP